MSTINPITRAAAESTSPASSTARTSGTEDLANSTNFLQLLVAQIKNQDPLNPTDGTQFLSQLAQFSQLEQLIGLRQDLNAAIDPDSGTTA